MTRVGWDRRVNDFRQEVNLIKGRANKTSHEFKELQRQTECCKVMFLTHQLKRKRGSLTRGRGVASIIKNGNGLAVTLSFAGIASIIAYLISQDGFTAADAGISGVNVALQGLGETDWAVSLDTQIVVTSRNSITAGRVWFTWDSVMIALNELKQQAQNGAHLGDFDNVIAEIRKSKKLVAIGNNPTNRINYRYKYQEIVWRPINK